MIYRMHHILAIVIFYMILSGCGGGDSADSNGTDDTTPLTVDELKAKIHQMDLTDAQGFVITGSNTASGKPALRYKASKTVNSASVTMDPNSLYKVKTDGTLERVAVKDSEDTEIDRGLVQPLALREVNANYLFMWFRITPSNVTVPYLVHKKTGLAYKAEGVVWQANDQRYKKIRSDNNGNIYVGHNSTVYKIDTRNLGNTSITAQAVQTQYKVHSTKWDIDDSGNILLFKGIDAGNSEVDIYVDLNDGSLSLVGQAMSATMDNYTTMGDIFRGLDGNLYVVGVTNSYSPHLFQASQDQTGALVLTSKRSMEDAPLLWGSNYRDVINGKLIYYSADDEVGKAVGTGARVGPIYEFDYETGIFKQHLKPGSQFKGDEAKGITISNGYMYFFGSDKNTTVDTVYRYDPATEDGDLFPTDAFSPINDFDINNIKVLGNNKVWFNAFRFSDSATVIGEMDMDNASIKIIDTIDAEEPVIIVMEAIRPADFIVIDGSYQDWHTDLRVQTDANNDGALGYELTYLSHQQSASQFFGLIEFDQDVIETTNAATIITIDGMYSIVIKVDEKFIIDLSDNSETSFKDVGAISAIGQAVEFSAPLSALSGIGSTPTVTVRSVSLENIVVSGAYSTPDHAVTITLPRSLFATDDVAIQLGGTYELQFTSTTMTLVDTSDESTTDLSGLTSGLDTASIEVVISDTLVGSTGSQLSPSSQDELDITQDEM